MTVSMINFFKHALDQKGWLTGAVLAIICPLSLGIIYTKFPHLKEPDEINFSESSIKIDNKIYHKTINDAEKDCSSGSDESMIYLDYHTNMLDLDANVDPRVIFDTAIWGIALSSCYSNAHSEKKSIFILRVLAASENCGGRWKAYSESARTFLDSYIGGDLVIAKDAFSICASETKSAT